MLKPLQHPRTEEDLLYPESDGKPLADNTTQFRLIVTIQGGLDILFANREDVLVVGDLLWYPVRVPKAKPGEKQRKPPSQAPDVMVAFGRPKGDRRSYKQWEEEDIPPQVTFEILSDSNSKGEMDKKWEFYQRYGVEEYYLYDPDKNQLQGWLRRGDRLEEIEVMEGWTSPRLGVSFSTSSDRLDIYYPSGEKFVNYIEMHEKVNWERQQAERAEIERQQAEIKRQQAEIERQQAEIKRQQAEIERQQAEIELEQTQSTLEEERQKNEQLRNYLQTLGIDPERLP